MSFGCSRPLTRVEVLSRAAERHSVVDLRSARGGGQIGRGAGCQHSGLQVDGGEGATEVQGDVREPPARPRLWRSDIESSFQAAVSTYRALFSAAIWGKYPDSLVQDFAWRRRTHAPALLN